MYCCWGSLLLATLTGWWVGRRSERNPERQLFRLLLVALLVARLAFVALYWAYYQDDWPSVIDIRDGGFIAWPGLVAALALGIWWGWRDRELRKPLGIALTVGILSWGSVIWPGIPSSRARVCRKWPCATTRGVRWRWRIIQVSHWSSISGRPGARRAGARCRCSPTP
ncbi:hypothetical protein SSTU70S_03333 [Stutzerimonas stutzeri]